MRIRILSSTILLAASWLRADPQGTQLAGILRPDVTYVASLSPTGRYLAYNVSDTHGGNSIHVCDLDDLADREWVSPELMMPPLKVRTSGMLSVPDGQASPHDYEYPQLFLWWPSDTMLVYANPYSVHTLDASRWSDREILNAKVLSDTDTVNVEDTSAEISRQFKIGLQAIITAPASVLILPYWHGSIANPLRLELESGRRIYATRDNDGFDLIDRYGNRRLFKPTTPGGNSVPPGQTDYRYIDSTSRKSLFSDGSVAFQKFLGTSAYLFPPWADGFYSGHAFPLGFAKDPNILIFASNVTTDLMGIYALDLTQKTSKTLATLPTFDFVDRLDLIGSNDVAQSKMFVLDRDLSLVGLRSMGARLATTWLDPRLAGIQAALERALPGKLIKIDEWSKDLERVVVDISSASDPGGFAVLDAHNSEVRKFIRRSPESYGLPLASVSDFDFTSSEGVHLTGIYAKSAKPRTNPPGLIVYLHDIPTEHTAASYDRNIQALASLSCDVAEVNVRGSSGLGMGLRNAVRPGYDEAVISDIRTALDWLGTNRRFDRKRILLFGVGYGGYVAARALQKYPGEFRAAVAFDGPLDPGAWIGAGAFSRYPTANNQQSTRNGAQLHFFSDAAIAAGANVAIGQGTIPDRPMLFIYGSNKYPETNVIGQQAESIQSAGRKTGNVNIFVVKTKLRDLLGSDDCADVYNQIQQFMMLSLYDYRVEIGPLKLLPESQ